MIVEAVADNAGREILLQAAALVTAIMVLGGAIWWLVGPRIERLVERACKTALGAVVKEHDERIERLETWKEAHGSPANLVEMAALFDLVNRQAPARPDMGSQRQGRRRDPTD